MKRIKTLIVRFNNVIQRGEVPLFRGAVLRAMEHSDVLFHNHQEEGGFRYSYPLIQYKRIHQKAAVICLEQGADVIGQFFSSRIKTISDINSCLSFLFPETIFH